MKKTLFGLLMLVSTFSFGQYKQPICPQLYDSPAVISGSNAISFSNDCGAMHGTMGYIINGSPATASIVFTGFMRGVAAGSVIDTYTGTTSIIRKPTFDANYDYFTIVPTFTGGTAPTFAVKVTMTPADSSATAGGGGTPTGPAGTPNAAVVSIQGIGGMTALATQDGATGAVGSAVPARGGVIAGKNGSGNVQDVATDSSGNVGVNIQNAPTVTMVQGNGANAHVNIDNNQVGTGPQALGTGASSSCAGTSTGGNGVTVTGGGTSTYSITATGTFTGTIGIYYAPDGINFVAIPSHTVVPYGGGPSITSITAVGKWKVAGLPANSSLMACGPTSTGTITLNLQASLAADTLVADATPADALAAPTNALSVNSWPQGWNGSTGDRLRTAGIGNTVASTGILATAAYCQFLTALPTLTTGTYGDMQCDPKGQLFVDLNYYAGSALGAMANYGTSPGAVLVPSVNAFITNVPAVSQSGTWNARTQDGAGNALTTNSSTFTAKFALDGNLLGVLGTAFTTAGKVDVKAADGDVFVRQATAANLNMTPASAMSGTVPGTAPGATDIAGQIFNSAGVAPSTGQTLPLQADSTGATLVAPQPSQTALVALTPSSQSALTTAVVAKASPGALYGFQVTNGAASVCYLEIMNIAATPTLGTGAVFSFGVPASGTLTLPPGTFSLAQLSTGISVGMATTYNGATVCGTAATAVIFYK